MKLDAAQAAQYAEQGYVFLPGLFTGAEVKAMVDLETRSRPNPRT